MTTTILVSLAVVSAAAAGLALVGWVVFSLLSSDLNAMIANEEASP